MQPTLTFIPNTQPAELVQPTDGTLHHPAVSPQFLAALDAAPGDARDDAAFSEQVAVPSGIVAFVGVQFVRTSSGPAASLFDGHHRIYQTHQLGRLMDIGRRGKDRERVALLVDKNMMLGALLTSIGRVLARFSAPFLAGTVLASALARLQSILPAMPNLSSIRRCSWCHMPAWCQSLRRRQHVMPLPQPISWGNRCQGRPECSTNRMPVSAALSQTRGRPPLGLGGSGGSSGSICAQSASGKSSLAMQDNYPHIRFCYQL